MVQIVKLLTSPRKGKRYRVVLSDGSHYDFGDINGHTYIDHGDKTKRDLYRGRHLGNRRERELIHNLTPSPALFSYYLLWGWSDSLQQNIKLLNGMLRQKYL